MKDAFLTRLDREDAQFLTQQCLLASDEYRKFTGADFLRLLVISARKAYMASGTVLSFVEWWQAKYQQFLAHAENQENHENQQNPQPRLVTAVSGRLAGPSSTRGPLRFSATTHPGRAGNGEVLAYAPPFCGLSLTERRAWRAA